ncbi:MAG: MOSC domain-containing protein [Gammaproteobacteria bacterium]|nr:MOSC domain-containing protein [Gammaproteobacteria bacterium]
MTSQARLFSRYIQDLPSGKLEWIGLRPARKEPMQEVNEVNAIAGSGLAGDRRCKASPNSARQVTIISAEQIKLIASLLRRKDIDPALLRRNLVVSGLNLNALRHQRFRIGDAEFEATAQCHPCSRMDGALGKGGCAAMLGHGGLCAKIIVGGLIKVGDEFIPLEQEA